MFAIWSDTQEAYLRVEGDETHSHIWDNRPLMAKAFRTEVEALNFIRRHFGPEDPVRVVVL